MRTSDFEYDLPEEHIARHPAKRRDESRLLALSKATGDVEHLRFHDLPGLMAPGDALVLNESRVLPARLLGRKPTGAEAEILLLRPWTGEDAAAAGGSGNAGDVGDAGSAEDVREGKVWEALVRPGGKLKPGRRVIVAPELEVEILDSTPENGRVVRLETALPVLEAIERFGHVPLPPYLNRAEEPDDRNRYQTVYARHAGSIAAPTAGLHFTNELLARIAGIGISIARITLHVGVGTFRPVEADDPSLHPMHAELYDVPVEAAQAINAARTSDSAPRIWAVGTTVVRTLESAVDDEGSIRAGSGETDLFIRPGFDFRVVDALITNFHLPRSTLLMLVAAFGGRKEVLGAYAEAIREGYRFYSYGDAMVVH